MDGEMRVRPRRGYEFIEEVKDLFIAELQGMGVEGVQAEKISGALVKALTREYGGGQPYIPINPGSKREENWEEVLEAHSRGKLSVQGMARMMDVGERSAYLRAKAYLRKRLPKAPSAPATAMAAPPAGFEPKQKQLHPWRKFPGSAKGMSLADQARGLRESGSGDGGDDPG